MKSGQAYNAEEFADIVVRSASDGTRVTLGDIANINDGFEEAQVSQQFNGQNSIEIDVFRTGLQSAIEVADEVKAYLEEAQVSYSACSRLF